MLKYHMHGSRDYKTDYQCCPDQAWGQVHLKICTKVYYKFFGKFSSTSTITVAGIRKYLSK